MKFLKEEVEAVVEWQREVTNEIASEISNYLEEETTLEQDEELARLIFGRLLADGLLEMPEGKKHPGGYVPVPSGGVISTKVQVP